jgi:methylthioribose-1-phosphate isomerase
VRRTVADAIAAELPAAPAAAAGALAAHLAALPGDHPGRPLSVLIHGDPGALTGGLVGIGITALRRLRDDGRALRLFVTETRPFMDGARLASWELRQADLEHTVVTDSAVAWLLAREAIDVVLLGAEWVAANGDCAGVIGSCAVAQLAGAAPPHPGHAGPSVVVCAITAAVDLDSADGGAIPVELRPAGDLVAYLAGVPIRPSAALVPATDVIPAATIGALVTERGVLWPPLASAIEALALVGGSSG